MDESISLEEGWEILEEGIAKAVARFLEEDMQMRFSSVEYTKYYTCAFRLGIQSFNYCEVIYDRYKSALEQIVTSMGTVAEKLSDLDPDDRNREAAQSQAYGNALKT
uniref:Cullin N-terminal domain-containing protein n=1 Tax=Ananas comosus var. bracteatus TaxID=296719 RepID=A0A6V7PC22_ANACO|nr:unnamed protein product [Ananas comosus var. bracteatus]